MHASINRLKLRLLQFHHTCSTNGSRNLTEEDADLFLSNAKKDLQQYPLLRQEEAKLFPGLFEEVMEFIRDTEPRCTPFYRAVMQRLKEQVLMPWRQSVLAQVNLAKQLLFFEVEFRAHHPPEHFAQYEQLFNEVAAEAEPLHHHPTVLYLLEDRMQCLRNVIETDSDGSSSQDHAEIMNHLSSMQAIVHQAIQQYRQRALAVAMAKHSRLRSIPNAKHATPLSSLPNDILRKIIEHNK